MKNVLFSLTIRKKRFRGIKGIILLMDIATSYRKKILDQPLITKEGLHIDSSDLLRAFLCAEIEKFIVLIIERECIDTLIKPDPKTL